MIKVNFINRKIKNSSKVYARLILNNIVIAQISTGKTILDNEKRNEIAAAIKECYKIGKTSRNELKNAILGYTDIFNLNSIVFRFLNTIQARMAFNTVKKTNYLIVHILNFLKSKKIILSIQMHNNIVFDFEQYLIHKKFSPNHIKRNVQFFKRFITYSFSQGYIKANYGAGYICETKAKHEINYLSIDDLRKIEKCNIAQTRLNRVRLLFLMQCYTGLAYIDLMDLNKSKFERKNGDLWLTGVRAKSGQTYFVPVEKKACILWEKLGQKIEQISNQKYNSYLKEIADIAGVKTQITTHTGRRTFGMIQLNTGYAIEDVSRMLGHNNISTTQKHYAKVLNERIIISRRNLQKIS